MKKHYKSDLNYNVVLHCLLMLESIFIDDEEYQKLFNALFGYVDSMIDSGRGGDIVDSYVVHIVDEL